MYVHITVTASQVEQYNTFETVSNFLSIQALNLNPRKTESFVKVRTTPKKSTHVPKDEWEAMSRAEKTSHIAKRKKKGSKNKPGGKNAKVDRVGTKDKGETDGKSDLEKATAIAKTMQAQFISGVTDGRSLEADVSEQQDDSQADGNGNAKPSVQKRKGKGQG